MESNPAISSSKKTIIVIDNDRGIREAIGEYLTRIGYTVFEAIYLKDALDYLEKHRGDLVITSLYRNDMNGFDFSKRVKDAYEIPVIILTGYTYSEEDAKASGADLIKWIPIQFDELLVDIETLL